MPGRQDSLKRPPRLPRRPLVVGTQPHGSLHDSVTRRGCGVPSFGLSAREVKQCRRYGLARSGQRVSIGITLSFGTVLVLWGIADNELSWCYLGGGDRSRRQR